MTTIRKLLIANRGEIACRIIRTAHAMGIATVAVFSDADAGAPFVGAAGEAVRLPGTAAVDTYLRGDLVVEAALRTGADAVHPGYGFLSERADFAALCAARGLVFVGPHADTIASMGSKIAAKRIMAESGVPVLPGATIEPEMTDARIAAAAEHVGYPVLVKASSGGGGRGMRIVREQAEILDAVESAQREALAAFGDGAVFLERLVESPRHVEVQVFGDDDGTVVHLFERECSIQRRHQKIIEEAPSPAVDPELREAICSTAVTAAHAVGYVNAGTVEFVLDPDGKFWFLEMNTRLQVEHPVTEMVTGLDLVELQLRVAQGEPLPDVARHATLSGHAIEARLYAEDVPAGFLPVSGPVDRLRVDATDVRVDAGYEDGSTVSVFYDAMLAKVVAWAPTRTVAVARLASALGSAQVHGITTNRDLLVGILTDDDFGRGATDTGFLERKDPTVLATARSRDDAAVVHAVVAAVAGRSSRRASSPLPAGIPPGWRNVGPAEQRVTYRVGEREVSVALGRAAGGETVVVDGRTFALVVHRVTDDVVDLELEGVRTRGAVQRVDDLVYVDSAVGTSTLRELPRFPLPARDHATGSLLSPMPGSVVAVVVEVGDRVVAGQRLLVLEAMKMEHAIRSPADGVVSRIPVTVGDQVDTGAVLAVVEVDGS